VLSGAELTDPPSPGCLWYVLTETFVGSG
jgi:hypothetical protein